MLVNGCGWDRLRPAAECGQAREEIRESFRDAFRIFDLDARELQADHREAHRDAMIVVSLDRRRAHRRRPNLQTVLGFEYVRADPSEFSCKRADAIAFVMTDKGNV